MKPTRIRRSLLIGLGGTGCQAVLFTKKKLLDIYGEVPKAIRFLVFDTTLPEELTAKDNTRVVLDESEFLRLQVKDTASLIESNPEVSNWFPESVPRRTITNGAGQVRALGRLALFANAKKVLDAIKTKLDEVRSYTVERTSAGYEVYGPDLSVSIVASLAGGTGSGIFLDVAHLVLSVGNLSSTDEISAYLLLPDIFLFKAAVASAAPNTYAALKELDHIMSVSGTEPFTFQFGGQFHKITRAPFDYIFVVNNKNRDSLTFDQVQEITEFIGTAMWLRATSTGKAERDIWDNMKNQTSSAESWKGKGPLYSSFGVSELVFSKEWFKDLFTKEASLSLISALVDPNVDTKPALAEAQTFIERMGLDPEKMLVETVRAVDLPRFDIPVNPTVQDFMALFSRKGSKVSSYERDIRDQTDARCEDMKRKLQEELRVALSRFLSNQGMNLTQAAKFISLLEERINERRESMVSLRNTAIEQKDKLVESQRRARESFDKGQRKLLGKKKAMASAARNFGTFSAEECSQIAEYYRTDKSIQIYDFLAAQIKTFKAHLNSLLGRLDLVKKDLESDIERKKSDKVKIKPFIIELRPDSLMRESVIVDPRDFALHLEQQRWSLIPGLSKDDGSKVLLSLRNDEILNFFNMYSSETKPVTELLSKTIEDILMDLPQEQFNAYVKQLKEAALPLWQYNEGYVSGPHSTQTFSIFAVPDAETTRMKEDVVRAVLGESKDFPVVSVNDPNRVICFKAEASLPAYVIHDMRRYKERYQSTEVPKGITCHTDRRWSSLPDLYPQAEEEQRYKIWALANALPDGWQNLSNNLIFKRGEHYYVRSQLRGTKRSPEYRLAQGRLEAFQAFTKDEELLREIETEVYAIIDRLGKERTLAVLDDYRTNLIQASKKSEESWAKLVDKELEAIEKWTNAQKAVF